MRDVTGYQSARFSPPPGVTAAQYTDEATPGEIMRQLPSSIAANIPAR